MVITLGGLIYAFLIQKSFRLKSHMTMGLTHELKSPLANIRSAVEYLSRNPNSTDYFDIIKRNTGRLEIFVNELLNLASIQDDTITLDRKNFSLVEAINSVCDVYRPLIEAKGVNLAFHHPQDPFIINADEGKIRQVVSNLLSNAHKFSQDGTITIELVKEDDRVYCSVTDEGPGIAKENIEKVFDRFFQEKRSTKGAGLGLAIAKAWVEAHGGRIWVEPKALEGGTLIKFAFPNN
jgi:signal transduction histidine kinase